MKPNKKPPTEFFLHIKVTPNSSRSKIIGKFLDEKNQKCLKINLAAVPQDGEANDELIKFLSKLLKIPQSKIEIFRGNTSRNKLLKISAEFDQSKLEG